MHCLAIILAALIAAGIATPSDAQTMVTVCKRDGRGTYCTQKPYWPRRDWRGKLQNPRDLGKATR